MLFTMKQIATLAMLMASACATTQAHEPLSQRGSQQRDLVSSTADDTENVIVHCKPGKDAECLQELEDLSAAHGDDAVRILNRMDGTRYVALKIRKSEEDAIRRLEDIFDCEDDPVRTILRDEPAVRRRLQQEVGYGLNMIRAREVWDDANYGNRGDGVTICVIDTGLAPHNDLDESKIVAGIHMFEEYTDETFQTDRDGHGTHVTGIISAEDNDIGMVGVAPNAKLIIVKMFYISDPERGVVRASQLIDAAQRCVDNGADIINMSLGGSRRSLAEEEAFTEWKSQGILSIAAAGNTGTTTFRYPASHASVMGVANVREDGTIASQSTSNDFVDVAAPGASIRSLSAFHPDVFVRSSGTSMSTPHVSGAAAMLMSAYPNASPDEIRRALQLTAVDGGVEGYDTSFGYGIIDVKAAADFMGGTYNNNNGNCNADEAVLEVRLNTDGAGYQTVWTLQRGEVQMFNVMGFENDASYIQKECIPKDACYTFDIFDINENGLCCVNGQGDVTVLLDGVEVFTASAFGFTQKSEEFGYGCVGTPSDPTTDEPTGSPTNGPTSAPTSDPTSGPTVVPTSQPTNGPTVGPTHGPTSGPTVMPTSQPTNGPTGVPTDLPTVIPTSQPTDGPTMGPTFGPTAGPTIKPTSQPTSQPTNGPTSGPTIAPTYGPTAGPTVMPTSQPTSGPTNGPTIGPTLGPTAMPSRQPQHYPTISPTALPTEQPTNGPTAMPTSQPTNGPTRGPTNGPTSRPTSVPTSGPTKAPVGNPTSAPTSGPTSAPSMAPAGDGSGTTATSCPQNVELFNMVGATQVPSIPIEIVEQSTTSVTYQFKQPWLTTVDAVWLSHPNEDTGDIECFEEQNVVPDQTLQFTARCQGESAVAIVDVFVADDTILNTGSDGASVPECCHSTVPQRKPTVHYIFEVHCKPQCP